jgi:hypothetical protein
VNDAPICERGQRMATIKRDPENLSGLILRYWRCHCVMALVGAELYRCIREMRQAIARRQQRQQRQPSRPWHGGDAA